ncbi:MAG: extracellular solute-binding protein [Clostridia bacterium]|nr:extracellular solute-binding protein [Clostridia bacterium]
MKIKRLISVILTIMLAFSALTMFGGCGDRTAVLKIYNWGEYIADGSYDSVDVISAFEEWYEEKTGEPIRVEYSMFDTNETMYTQIANKRADYDVICPSDYTVQKLIRNDLLLPINDENFDTIWADTFEDEDPTAYGLGEDEEITLHNIMNQGLLDLITVYDSGWVNGGSIYSVPFMWGTVGLLYDKAKIEAIGGDNAVDDMQTWDTLFEEDYAGYKYMKNSVRDAYAIANIYHYSGELSRLSNGFTEFGKEYKELLSQCMNYPNEETIASAEQTLKNQKKYLYAYESDEGKEDLKNGKSQAAMALVWSCDAGYVIGMEENLDLWYSVPKEGTNVWVDNWCIPKYAGNKKAAQYFISFVNTYEMAYENMYWVGSATPVRQAAEDIAYEITNPRSLLEYEYLEAYAEEEGEEYVEEHYDEIIAEADADWKEMVESEDEALSDYVYFLEKYLESHEDCTDEEDCSCEWHAYARMYSEALNPTDEQLERAAIMTDFAEKNTDVVRMFTRVKAG